MLFGTAKELITPHKPIPLACVGGAADPFHRVHDDVYVRTLVLEEGGNKVAFMSFDLLFHDRSLNDPLEAYAQSTYGIRPGGLIITHTHAHTAPATNGYNWYTDPNYEVFLLERAKVCLDRAMASLIPGTLECGCFEADYNISRRGKVNGVYTIAPNFDYVHDREFMLLCVRDQAGTLRSVMMNYPCHPVFYPTRDELSGEFPARVCHYIDAHYYGCMSLYTQSSAGDVRPRPTAQPTEDGSYAFGPMDFAAVDAFAADMSRGVTAFIDGQGCHKIEMSALPGCCAFTIDLPMDPAPFSYFEEMAKVFENAEPGIFKNNTQYIINGGYEEMPHSLTLHCQIIRLSEDYYIATVGGEPCYGVKQAIVAAFGGKQVMFIGYTDACAYLVDDVLLEEGGYEPEAYLEYRLIGPLKKGVTALYTQGFAEARKKLEKE